jgi:hypothetical protein
MSRRRSTGRFSALDWEVVHFCILQAAEVLPDRVQLGTHDASTGALARRHGHLDERIIVVVGLGVGEAHDAPFHHLPAAFDYHLDRIGSEPIPLRHAPEEQVDHSDHG